jgi:hypothetical protein
MSARRVGPLVLVVLLLGACTKSPPTRWEKVPQPSADAALKQAEYECEQDAALQARLGNPRARVLKFQSRRESGTFEDCMAARGYRKAP